MPIGRYNKRSTWPEPDLYRMHYVSTRATSASAARNPQRFSDILLAGLAPDGGLYLPETYPQVSGAELDAWRKLSYAELA